MHVPDDQAAGEAIAANVARISPAAGPPWAGDQRLAAAAALIALGAT